MPRPSMRSVLLPPLVCSVTGLLLWTLAGCAAQTPTPGISAPAFSGCIGFDRITFDRLHDTAPTIQQIKAYDAERDAVCGAGK